MAGAGRFGVLLVVFLARVSLPVPGVLPRGARRWRPTIPWFDLGLDLGLGLGLGLAAGLPACLRFAAVPDLAPPVSMMGG